MLQIKTVHNTDPAAFDEAVNTSLAEGWTLTRRLIGPGPDFVAELEREIVTGEERCCENCKFYEQQPESEPCRDCSKDYDEWEPVK